MQNPAADSLYYYLSMVNNANIANIKINTTKARSSEDFKNILVKYTNAVK